MNRLMYRLLAAVAPAHRREWIAAMFSEAHHLQGRERISWYAAAAGMAFASRVSHSALFIEAIALAMIMIAVDWTSGALLPALLLIGLSAAVLTRVSASRSRAAVLVAGGTLPLTHAIANWVPQLRPHYQYAPLDLRDWTILAAVAAIGIAAVRIAEMLRTKLNAPGASS